MFARMTTLLEQKGAVLVQDVEVAQLDACACLMVGDICCNPVLILTLRYSALMPPKRVGEFSWAVTEFMLWFPTFHSCMCFFVCEHYLR